ncbi:hypothetical protein WA1_33315 [Scytonema hofmannii PCC 7110]|uniref:Uncharacterized protein n=2 Tax=Scytonema hofmannii TaxID=34078 RepID=A0A139X2I9_9CYAN|nr:hypothetical protein WA1_33315 [Scytonema hofmannii PCC 7110]
MSRFRRLALNYERYSKTLKLRHGDRITLRPPKQAAVQLKYLEPFGIYLQIITRAAYSIGSLFSLMILAIYLEGLKFDVI